jgi:hypothetical protein
MPKDIEYVRKRYVPAPSIVEQKNNFTKNPYKEGGQEKFKKKKYSCFHG